MARLRASLLASLRVALFTPGNDHVSAAERLALAVRFTDDTPARRAAFRPFIGEPVPAGDWAVR